MKRAEHILSQFDEDASLEFPALDSPKDYLASTRLTAYCDAKDWALTIETLVWATRTTGYDRIETLVYVYGSCLIGKPGTRSQDTVHPASEGPDGPVFAYEFGDAAVRPEAKSIRLRKQVVRFDASRAQIVARGIRPVSRRRVVEGPDLLRLLALDYADLLLATDEERRRRIRRRLPVLLQLNEWHHPDVLLGGELPSDTECFQSLAEALAACDASLYRPTERPNTHWRHWPGGGSM